MKVQKSFADKFEKLSAPKQNALLVDAIVKNCIECCGGVRKEAIDCLCNERLEFFSEKNFD